MWGKNQAPHHTLEEGGTFRRRTTEATSSLSVAQNSGDLPGFHASVVAHRFCDARVRGRVSMHSLGTSCLLHSAPSLGVNPMPPRITQQSHRPRASHRMMVGTYANTWLA